MINYILADMIFTYPLQLTLYPFINESLIVKTDFT